MAATQILPDRYRDAQRLARGAMGDIYRATDTTLDRVVAVKLLAEPYVADDAARGRFAREARAAARVSGDPNIVTIYDVGDAGGRPCIVMEYIDGCTIEQRLAAGRQRPADAMRWLEQAGRALDYAHANGVVHRDVKPGNLLLDRADDVHVADFGIASAAWLPSLTVSGTILGTAGYLAPEQALGEPTSPASDRYALGTVAYELLTGTRPFARESPTAEAQAHAFEPVPSAAARSGMPSQVDAVFRRALAKRPGDRYATCAAFVSALRTALAGAPTETRARAAATMPLARPVRRGTASRVPLLAALLIAALVPVAIAGVVLARPSSSERATPPTKPAKHVTPRHTTTTPVTTTTPAAQAASVGPHTLNDRAWGLMQRGRYAGALPLLQQAVPALRGAGPADPAEGYANYNLGYTLLQLGRCSEALPYLQRAQSLEPERAEVSSALAQVDRCLGAAPQDDNGNGGGNGKHKGRHKKGHD